MSYRHTSPVKSGTSTVSGIVWSESSLRPNFSLASQPWPITRQNRPGPKQHKKGAAPPINRYSLERPGRTLDQTTLFRFSMPPSGVGSRREGSGVEGVGREGMGIAVLITQTANVH